MHVFYRTLFDKKGTQIWGWGKISYIKTYRHHHLKGNASIITLKDICMAPNVIYDVINIATCLKSKGMPFFKLNSLLKINNQLPLFLFLTKASYALINNACLAYTTSFFKRNRASNVGMTISFKTAINGGRDQFHAYI